MAVTVELDDRVSASKCPTCDRQHLVVRGFLYKDGSAWIVYWASLFEKGPGHPHPAAVVTLAIAEDWSEDASTASRRWAQLEVWPGETEIQMHFNDPDGQLDVAVFGERLGRDAALSSPLKDAFLEGADRVVLDDPRVAGLLNS
jgi:hypothetical protein